METTPTESLPPAAANSSTTLAGRIFDVYASPGEVFEGLRGVPPRVSNWLVPVLIACVVSLVYVAVAFSQPNVRQQLREKQENQLQKMIAAGTMNAADADAARSSMETLGFTAAAVAGGLAAIATNFVLVFLGAVVLQVLGAWLGTERVGYTRAAEITGLATMILVLGAILQTLLVVLTGNLFISPGPVLLLKEMDLHNKVHLALASINLMTVWYLVVLAIGLARLGRMSFGKAALPLLGLWALLRVGVVWMSWKSAGI